MMMIKMIKIIYDFYHLYFKYMMEMLILGSFGKVRTVPVCTVSDRLTEISNFCFSVHYKQARNLERCALKAAKLQHGKLKTLHS